MDPTQFQRFYRFHPKTGQDANEFELMLTVEQREELASMVRAGAKFYWQKTDEIGIGVVDGYTRVEKTNIEFVLKVTGANYQFFDTAQGEDS